MKYCEHKYSIRNETAAKTAALRLINDIALVDVDLAARLKPGIDRFVESVASQNQATQQNKTTNSDLLNKLSEFFTLQSTTDKADWLKQHTDIVNSVKAIMDSKDNDIDEADDSELTPGLDAGDKSDSTDNKHSTDTKSDSTDKHQTSTQATQTAAVNTAVIDKPQRKGILDKMQLENKLRAYVEACLADFITSKVNTTTVQSNVEGYNEAYATDGFDDNLDVAFNKVLDALVAALLGNYN